MPVRALRLCSPYRWSLLYTFVKNNKCPSGHWDLFTLRNNLRSYTLWLKTTNARQGIETLEACLSGAVQTDLKLKTTNARQGIETHIYESFSIHQILFVKNNKCPSGHWDCIGFLMGKHQIPVRSLRIYARCLLLLVSAQLKTTNARQGIET